MRIFGQMIGYCVICSVFVDDYEVVFIVICDECYCNDW